MDLGEFIGKWSAARGGAERANYQMFLGELCQAIGVPSPDPAGHDTAHEVARVILQRLGEVRLRIARQSHQ